MAAEDARFYEHRGLDLKAILRALIADFRAGEPVQGGSTITQQYVKNVFVGARRTLFRKVREALTASSLERSFSKKKILERYLNTIYLGKGAYGVEAAARTFFDKPAADLSLSEAALLAGLIRAPERYSPYKHPPEAELRRVYVIGRMAQLGLVSPAEAEQARKERPVLVERRTKQEVFRYPWFVDVVTRYLLKRYGEDRVFTGGLEIHTTLDPRLQELAEQAVRQALPSVADPHASLVAIDPATGYVLALVGGRDYEREKFNLAIQARRQPGSAFKPFVLLGALESGILPDRRYSGPGEICLPEWKPDCKVTNFDKDGFGSITMEKATISSVNTVFAQIVLEVGP
ncbi:MAG: transglycosylase domain-containing protein, partial [Candidatus Methylomirabilales bacterium]